MKCPYCKKELTIPNVVENNIESYGSRRCNFPCNKCKKIVSVFGSRRLYFHDIAKTDKESDWAI